MLSSLVTSDEHRERRQRLRSMVPGPVVLLGNDVQRRNLPGYGFPFRQDSTFAYFTGVHLPQAAVVWDDDGETLFLPAPHPDDALWHGEVPSLDALGARYGFARVRDRATLDRAVPAGARTLAVPNDRATATANALCGSHWTFGGTHGDPDLVRAVIQLRRAKSAAEIAEMRGAAERTFVAYDAVLRSARPGVTEQALTALFEGVLAATGHTLGYGTILTQRGEILHNHHHDRTLEAGRLLLLDGGGEAPSGYGCDITRTWPVSGKFDAQQRAVYDAVLAAQAASIAAVAPGRPYRAVHDASARVIAEFLSSEGLIHCDPDEAVAMGAHALFFPHGVGHHLGLDVHDLENFGDLPSYPPGVGRSEQFGTRYLRLNLPLDLGWVVTIEPGIYFVPAILRDATLRARFAGVVDFDRASTWLGFGGVRIEDDVHVTADGPEVLTRVPKDADVLEALIGTGHAVEALR